MNREEGERERVKGRNNKRLMSDFIQDLFFDATEMRAEYFPYFSYMNWFEE